MYPGTSGCGSPIRPLSQPLLAHTVTECTNHVSLHSALGEDWQCVVGMGLLFFTFYLMAPGGPGMTDSLALCTSLLLLTALVEAAQGSLALSTVSSPVDGSVKTKANEPFGNDTGSWVQAAADTACPHPWVH